MTKTTSLSLKDNERFAYIDALRGLAALYVLFFHVAAVPKPGLVISPWIAPLIMRGYSGVILFFVVSAFTLCSSSTMRNKSSDSPLFDFYVRRIFRIVPLYYFWFSFQLIRESIYNVERPFAQILAGLFFTFNFIPGWESGGLVWASWTLGVEMIFYLIFPFVFFYVTNDKRALVFVVLTILIAMIFPFVISFARIPDDLRASFLYLSFFRQLPAFAFGMLTFYVYNTFIAGKIVRKEWSFLLLCVAFLGYFAYTVGLLNPIISNEYILIELNKIFGSNIPASIRSIKLDELPLQALIYSCLLLGLAIYPWKIISNPITTFFGKISYSVYLCHPVFIYYLTPVYRNIYSLPLRPTIQYGICAVLTLALVTMTSYITYLLIEKPGMNFGKLLITKRINRKTLQVL